MILKYVGFMRPIFLKMQLSNSRNLSRGFSFIIKNMNEQNYLIVSDNIGIINLYKNLIVKLDRERGKYEEIKKDVISNDSV